MQNLSKAFVVDQEAEERLQIDFETLKQMFHSIENDKEMLEGIQYLGNFLNPMKCHNTLPLGKGGGSFVGMPLMSQ